MGVKTRIMLQTVFEERPSAKNTLCDRIYENVLDSTCDAKEAFVEGRCWKDGVEDEETF